MEASPNDPLSSSSGAPVSMGTFESYHGVDEDNGGGEGAAAAIGRTVVGPTRVGESEGAGRRRRRTRGDSNACASLLVGGAVGAVLLLLASCAALLLLRRTPPGLLRSEQYRLLADEYGMSSPPEMARPYSDNGGGGGIGEYLPLLGKSNSAKAIRAQDEVRRYREAFLDRPELLDTEEFTGLETDERTRTRHATASKIAAPLGCESTIILLRHCEKGDIREHCDYLGYERSVYLSTLFGDGPDERWPAPSYVYALNPGERADRRVRNQREVETVRPLAEKFGLTLDQSYGLNEVSKLSKHVFGMLRSGEMCGKIAVVSWKHEDLPRLAHHLGCGPFEGCPMDYPSSTFDQAWQIRYVRMVPWNSDKKKAKLQHRHHSRSKEATGNVGKPTWKVFGNVQSEGFDPLQFSKKWGDYPEGGIETGGRWMPTEVKMEEERVISRLKEDNGKH